MEAESDLKPLNKRSPCLHPVTQSGLKYAVAWVTYVLLGSYLFLVLETTTELQEQENGKWTKFKDLLSKERGGWKNEEENEFLLFRNNLSNLCPYFENSFNETFDELLVDLDGTAENNNKSIDPQVLSKWIADIAMYCFTQFQEMVEVSIPSDYSYVDAIYYTMTLVTTIGFGHFYPKTSAGKVFCIAYAMVGVPLTCILMAKNSDMLSNKMLNLYETSKKRRPANSKALLYIITWLFLIVGFVVFMFIPSVAFVYIENWSYVSSVYFTFITLTTIGFGEYIAGYANDDYMYPELYRMCIVIWIMLALGYWVLVLNFLIKAIKSNTKTFRRHFKKRNIARQADFIRQLMRKVRLEDVQKAEPEETFHKLSLMVESVSRQGSFAVNPEIKQKERLNRRSSRRVSVCEIEAAVRRSMDIRSQFEENDKEEASISFDDLMKVNVVVRTETVPGFETLVTKANETNQTSRKMEENHLEEVGRKRFEEVVLPLRDVLGVVLLVASFEESSEEEPTSEYETFSEDDSSPSSGTIVDPRDSVPLLKNIFLNSSGSTKLEPKKSLTEDDKEKVKSMYYQTALTQFLEECPDAEDEGDLGEIEREEEEQKGLL